MKHKATLSVLIASALTASYMGVNAMPGAGSYEAGDGASASGQNSVAVGSTAEANVEDTVVIWAGANATKVQSVVVGRNAVAMQ